MTSRNALLGDLANCRMLALRDNLPERPATAAVEFDTAPQPKFNKNFEMLADDMIRNSLRGYTTYILSENKVQVERLENIFHQIGRGQAVVRPLSVTLHEGFVDNDLKALGKLNRVAYHLAVLGQRVYTRNIIVVLECCYNRLQC